MSRILFLVSSMQGGGAERIAALLCNHWAKQGHDVTLMPTFSGHGECVYPLDDRVRLDYLADHVTSHRQSIVNKARRYFALRRIIRTLAPDVVVSFLPHVNVAAVFAAWNLRIPVVVSERVHPPTNPLGTRLKILRRIAYSRATGVVVQTQRTLAWLEVCCPKSKGWVIPNPVVYPLPRREPIREPAVIIGDVRRVMLAVGRLDAQKGFDQLLTAFAALAKRCPEWDLVILGEGVERERLVRQRDALGVSGRVYLPGQSGNPGDWYVRADCYVMSSRFEGFPNTLLEAMAYGLPSVSFDCETGPAEIIREGVDGCLVAPTEGAPGLSRAMETLMQDESKRRRMGAAAVSVRERFSVERITHAWDDVLGLRRAGADV